jgi:hypothetical protein
MQTKSNPREKEFKNTMSELADKTLKNYQQALQTGFKLQEETLKCWSSLLSESPATPDLQQGFKTFSKVANSILPAAQRRMEEAMDIVNKSTRTGTELMRKAVDAAHAQGVGDGHNKLTDFWMSSVGAMRSNTEALAHLNARAIDSWLEIIRRGSEMAETHAPKPA